MLNIVKLLKRTCIETVVIALLWATAIHITVGFSDAELSSVSVESNYSHLKNASFNTELTSPSVQNVVKEATYLQNNFVDTEAQSGMVRVRKPLIVRKGRNSDVISSVQLSTLATELPPTRLSTLYTMPARYSSLVRRPAFPLSGERASAQSVSVIVGVLLPFSGNRSFVIRKVAPAFERAVEKVTKEMGPWTFHSVTVLYGDSQCDIAASMNQAIQLYERQRTSAFFGPVCDYAIAPVARQARYWNTPLITAGATAFDYYWLKNTTYSTLTRIGPANLQGCSEFLQDVAMRYGWEKFIVVYDSQGQDDHLVGFCHLLVDYLHCHFKDAVPRINMDHYKLDDGVYTTTEAVLRNKIKTEYSGCESRLRGDYVSLVKTSRVVEGINNFLHPAAVDGRRLFISSYYTTGV